VSLRPSPAWLRSAVRCARPALDNHDTETPPGALATANRNLCATTVLTRRYRLTSFGALGSQANRLHHAAQQIRAPTGSEGAPESAVSCLPLLIGLDCGRAPALRLVDLGVL